MCRPRRRSRRARAAEAGGDLGAAVALLETAIALWRGPSLGDVAVQPGLQGEATRLDELRTTLIERRLEALLDLGQHDLALGELVAHCAAWPLREHLWALRMTALYRSGRQAEALRTFEELRINLREELGIEPGPELRDLQLSVLEQRSELTLPRTNASISPHESPRPHLEGSAAVSQVVTVIFTDLVDSTALGTRLGPDGTDQIRRKHFALLRGALDAHGGVEVKNLGDGLMAVFSITSFAINCAEAMQQAIHRFNVDAPETLSVRIGIGHGEVTVDDGDYFGDAVIEASRLCARAEGGQILATQLAQLTAGRRAVQEVSFVGELDLKGLPSPTPTVEIRWRPEQVDERSAVPLPQRCARTSSMEFVGRVPERSVLAQSLKSVSAGSGHRLILIGGEPGVGKTTLAIEASRAADLDGSIVLFGASDEDARIPYGPWAEALAHLFAHVPADLLAKVAPFAESLVRLNTDLMQYFGEVASGVTSDPEIARFLLFEAVTNTLRFVGDIAPVVIVLDDIHWADEQSLQLMNHLARSLEPMRLMLIGTFRESEVSASTALADALAGLHRVDRADRIMLKGLDDDGVLALMEKLAGQPLNAEAMVLRDALMAETDGNPFFVGELLRHLAETGAIYRDDRQWVASNSILEHGLPVSVREVIQRRIARLGNESARLLTMAAVLGREFDLELLAVISEADEETLLDLMDQATEASLIDNPVGSHFRFVHALIEHSLYESISPARRLRLHRRAAEAIESRNLERNRGRSAELARHWCIGAPGDPRAIQCVMAAGDEALARLAPNEGIRWFNQGFELWASYWSTDRELHSRLLYGLGVAQRQSGVPAYRESLIEAAQLAEEWV